MLTDWLVRISPFLTALTAMAAFIAAGATLAYVRYSRQQTEQLRLSTSYEAVKGVIDMLEEVRSERHIVYKLPDDHSTWDRYQEDAAEKVMRRFDIYGLLDRKGFVSRDLLRELYKRPAVKVWEKVEKYIQAERIRRGQPGHMHELQELASRARHEMANKSKQT